MERSNSGFDNKYLVANVGFFFMKQSWREQILERTARRTPTVFQSGAFTTQKYHTLLSFLFRMGEGKILLLKHLLKHTYYVVNGWETH